jgi:hypothetical protein
MPRSNRHYNRASPIANEDLLLFSKYKSPDRHQQFRFLLSFFPCPKLWHHTSMYMIQREHCTLNIDLEFRTCFPQSIP